MLTDEGLIRQIRNGNQAAFAAMYERYRPSVFAYCRRILGNPEDAEDTVQDVLIKVRNEIDTLRNGTLFKHWLFRIARNEALLKIRKRHPIEDIDPNLSWDAETPLEGYERKETSTIVQALLKDLKHEFREVLILREFDGLSYSEISKIVGISEDLVKVRIYRARNAMTEKLKKFYD